MSELELLIKNSIANEQTARKLFEIETAILSCQSSNELLNRLFALIKDKFSLLHVALLLVEPTPIDYLLSSNIQTSWHRAHCHSISTQDLLAYHPDDDPFLTNDLTLLSNNISLQCLKSAGSAALIPLKLENKLFGSLLFTDIDPQRFHKALGTFHLEQLAVKVSLCLSNVFIREQLEYMANYDRLTGVANRRLMENYLEDELIRQRRYKTPFSVIFIDCDKFKQINDTYGHDCGDKVLVYVATQLQGLIRKNDKCFRYAGDEFVISLANQGINEAALIAQRLSNHFLTRPMPYEEKIIPIAISCGAAASDGSLTIDALLKKADSQLYLDKKRIPHESCEHDSGPIG
jgi:diguanylate cyclase (GGDEF)-like protein